MGKIRIGSIFCICTLLIACLSSCEGRRLPWDYRDDRFSANICWQSSEGIAFMGEVAVEEGGGLRLCLSSPKVWEGVVVSRSQEETRVEFEGMTVKDVSLGEIDEVLDLLCPEGEIRIVTRTEWKGRRVLYGEIEKAGEEGEGIYELYLEEKTGVPLEIRRGERSVTFLTFRTGG